MYIFKKNIIMVPVNFDGLSLSKGILTLDCQQNTTFCNLRTYNFKAQGNIVLGIAVNKKLTKVNLDEKNLQNYCFKLDFEIKNTDNISIVLLNVGEHNYDILLWGSTELNSTWQSTLDFMLTDEFKFAQHNAHQQSTWNGIEQNAHQQNSWHSAEKTTQPQNTWRSAEQTTQPQNTWRSAEQTAQSQNCWDSAEQTTKSQDACDYEKQTTQPKNAWDYEEQNIKSQNVYNGAEQKSDYDWQVGASEQSTNLAQGNPFEQDSQILKDCNINDFLDDVVAMHDQNLDQNSFDDSQNFYHDQNDASGSQNFYYDKNDVFREQIAADKQSNFFERISYQVEKMFVSNPQEDVLNEILPNSKFCRVEFDDQSGHYVFGVIYDEQKPKYLCYGVPAKKDSPPPKELTNYYQWLPIDVDEQDGDGYYMMYQEAETGKSISVEII